MRERLEPKESADATEPAEPIERTEPAEPIEPIEQIEPTEPIERIEPSLATDKIESLEFSDQSAFIRPTYRPPNRVSANVGPRREPRGDVLTTRRTVPVFLAVAAPTQEERDSRSTSRRISSSLNPAR